LDVVFVLGIELYEDVLEVDVVGILFILLVVVVVSWLIWWGNGTIAI